MAKTFISGSTLCMNALDTTLGNYEYTQPWTVCFQHAPAGNFPGSILAKQKNTGSFSGWEVFARNGTTNTQYAAEVCNTTVTPHRAAIHTTNEFASGSINSVIVTYDGSGVAAGMNFYVGNVLQTPVVITDTLAGNSILTSENMQIGCRGGSGSSGSGAQFLGGDLSRVLLYNAVISSTDRALYTSGGVPTTNLVLWQELSDVGATLQPDYSGNGHTFSINFTQSYWPGPTPDQFPVLGRVAPTSLSGPLTRPAGNPFMKNLGWVSSSNNGRGDQIGPGVIIKYGPGDYRGWIENATGVKSIDVGNQPGAFDQDTPTIYGTSSDGTHWSFVNQDTGSAALITSTNVTTNPTGFESAFRSSSRAETSVSSLFYDPDDSVYKAWGHCGNNAGVRRIYYFKCTSGSADPSVAGTWVVQNSGSAVVTTGSAGSFDSKTVSDFKVLRINSSLMVGTYIGYNSASIGVIAAAKSVDRGLTWTKLGVAIGTGSIGQWDQHSVTGPPAAIYDPTTGYYLYWYGATSTGSINGEAIGFAYATDPTVVPYTKGIFNPVLCKQHGPSGSSGTIEVVIANTQHCYIDGATFRIMIKADNGVSGVIGFRGRIEADATNPGFRYRAPNGGVSVGSSII